MGEILLGILIMAMGLWLVVKTEWMMSNFGRIAWFEEKLGTEGGSRLGYKLVGILFIIVGTIVMTGSGPDFMSWLVSPLIRYN